MVNVVKRKTLEQLRAEYHAEVERLANLTFDRYVKNLQEPLYLVGQYEQLDKLNSHARVWKNLTIMSCEEVRASSHIVIRGEPLPRNLTREGLYYRIKELLDKEPLYIFAD